MSMQDLQINVHQFLILIIETNIKYILKSISGNSIRKNSNHLKKINKRNKKENEQKF